jgi:hypothetical protein
MSMLDYFKHIFLVDSSSASFSYYINLKAIKTSSMETTNSSLDGNIATKTNQFLFQEVCNP